VITPADSCTRLCGPPRKALGCGPTAPPHRRPPPCHSALCCTCPLQEDTGTPGRSGGTYAILQDGQVVGLLEHVHSSSRVFGRRGGPADVAHTRAADRAGHAMELAEAAAEQVGARLAQLFSNQLDFANAVQEQLMAIRCPRARMAALAQLQMASAAAGGAEIDLPQALLWMQPRQGRMAGGGPHPLPAQEQLPTEGEFGDFTMVQHKLFGPQGELAAAEEQAEAAMEAAFVAGGPVMEVVPEGEQGEEARHWHHHHEQHPGHRHQHGEGPWHHHHEHFEHRPEHRHGEHRAEHENFKPQDSQAPWWDSMTRPHAAQWWDSLFRRHEHRGQPGDRAAPGGFALPVSGITREHRRWLNLQRSAMPGGWVRAVVAWAGAGLRLHSATGC
jgi:hypothetical protein